MTMPEPLRTVLALGSILAAVLLVSCAGQAPPPGGPEDRIPPEIVSTYPAPYATYYSDRTIAIEFSEYVDRRSVEGAVFVSPDVGRLEYDWSGHEVEITFADSLRPNTTYVVTVGTDVVDLRNRNRMARALSLAFSTGGEIDRGAIVGVVYGESNEASQSGILVLAYQLDGVSGDTLNPRWTKPDYVTQTGGRGEFALQHLRLGRYRMLALRDEYRNLLYDPQTDAFGLLASDVTLTPSDTTISGLTIKMAVEDTTAPTLIKATARSAQTVEVEFSEPVRELSISPDSVGLQDTLSGARLEVLAMTVKRPERTRYLLVSAVQDSMALYRLTVKGVQDSVGNRINPTANSLTFMPHASPDTSAFHLVGLSVRDSAQSVETVPTFELFFSRPAKQSVVAGAVRLADTLGRPVSLDTDWNGSMTLAIRPTRALAYEAWYTLKVRVGAFTDLFAVKGPDTTITVSMQVVSADRFGSIEGTVSDESATDARGPIVVLARPVEGSGMHTVRATVAGPGPFDLTQVPEGRYQLGAFRDRNANGLFDAGSVFPYAPSERYRILPDTLRVRARWPYEGALIKLR